MIKGEIDTKGALPGEDRLETGEFAGDLDLAPIGNCSVNALIDRMGRYVWACAPRFDSDPVFSSLLSDHDPAKADSRGTWAIDLVDFAEARQSYMRNTAVLRTELIDKNGAALEILDFSPRYVQFGRIYRPTTFIRIIRPLSGAPNIRVRLAPTADWGAAVAAHTSGSNHIRYLCSDVTLRLTTNCPVSHILESRVFRLEHNMVMFLGPDEGVEVDIVSTCERMLAETMNSWRQWVRTLSVPLEWQEAVIRAAIALKLCAYEETGAIVAAMTTSIPEAPNSGRNWDYRYCWLRDAYYVVQALNRLGAADMLENYLRYLRNLIDQSKGGHIQPVYGIGLEPAISERTIPHLPGFRGMGPVRAGNQAYEHLQYDVYGQIILSAVQAFFDERLLRPATIEDFQALEKVGDQAFLLHDQPDAGLWEFRTRASVHTYSAVMCWAACDRLGNAADTLGLHERAAFWRERAEIIRARVDKDAWNEELGRFAASFGGSELDASLLQMVDLRFIAPDDPRNQATFAAIEAELKRGKYLMRYVLPDDFGEPETAFNVCTFWFIEALKLSGRDAEARELFEEMLSRRTHAGLLSEDISLEDGRLWGNYPQTYSLVGLINCAGLLSAPWSSVR
jgi:GH15 family glucan-1,4-alpha-glucosidase